VKAQALTRIAGELAVIVLGVLIALAADRWIQAADARTDEQFYIAQLASDIRADSAKLEDMVDRSAVRNQAALDLLLYADTDNQQLGRDPQQFMIDVWLASVFGTNLEYTTDTWEDLVSSGGLSSIRDPALRAELSGYYNEIERVKGLFEGRSLTPSTTLDELLPPLQSLALNPAFLPSEVRADHQPTVEDAARFLRELTSREDLLAHFAGMRRTWTVSLNVHRGLLDRAAYLLEQLEADRS
jgi:hypothetical protein